MRPNEELLKKIALVRSRWKAFLWVRGLAWILGVMVVSLLIGLTVADSANLPSWAVIALSLGLVAVFVLTVVRVLVMPLRRTPTDAELARFVEEKNPGLEDRLVTAVEAVHKAKTEQVAFVHLLTKDALDRTKHVRFGDQVNKRKFSTFAALSGIFAVALLVSLYISSLFFPIGSARLLAFTLRPPAIDKYEIKVTPGDQTVPRGSDVLIQAVMTRVDPPRADVHLRYSHGTQYEASTMEVTPQTVPTFRHLVFNLQEAVHYFVEADGHKSKEFTIDVADLPRVEKLDYTYHYPPYTGLALKKEENASDMVALKGTEVEVVVTASQALSGGRIVFADGKAVTLQPSGEKMATGRVTVDRTTSFRIELTNTDRQKYLGLEEFSMEALDDQKPIVEFTKPGRDTKATKVEEVFTELRAEDDFGVNQLELYYSVNGSPEQKIELFTNKGESPKEISASHTFFLEEHDLQPGDFITYYGKAVDSHRPPNTVSTDIYFIEVRPFGREYYQGQQGGGGGGGGEDDSAEALSKRQKDIIAATFKLIRDKAKFQTKEWTDNIHAVSASQSKLSEQTNTLMQRLARRGLSGQSKTFKDLSENLKQAIEQMGPAAEQLKNEQADAALPYEQKALQYLMRAEALFTEIQVTMGSQGGGGGGRQSAEDLADLFELELDQNKNQYETLQRGEKQQNPQEIDEAIRKLKELAERQQKLMERRAQQARNGGSGGGSDQMTAQELQKETERLARQLDKLSRENNDRQMADVSRSLQQAARNMQQQGQSGTPQQQQQAAQQALEQLQRAQRLLTQGRGGNMDQQLAQLQQQAKRLREQQNKIADQAEQLAASPNNDGKRRAQEINQQKDPVQSELKSMTDALEALSNSQENREAANKARSAANTIKSKNLQGQMNQSRQFLDNGYYNYAARNEREIAKNLGDV